MTGCTELVDLFKENSRFVLGISHPEDELTHMQLMKIRCGGLQGMQRELIGTHQVPDVLEIISLTKKRYGSVNEFPFNEIVRDIKDFNHRKKKNSKKTQLDD